MKTLEREQQGAALIDAIQAAIAPLMPLFLRYEVSLQDLKEAISGLFVFDTAEKLKREGRPPSVARLALMTGLTKGEVEKHLSARTHSIHRRSFSVAQAESPAIVLAEWNRNSQYSTPYGVALDLPLESSHRSQRSFRQLVEIASPGTDPDMVLDQLVAAGCVEIVKADGSEGGFVRCTDRAYIPATISIERLSGIGASLGALASNLTHNVSVEPGQRYLERRVQSEFLLSEDGHRDAREFMSSEALRFLETLDSWLAANRLRLEGMKGRAVGLEMFMFDVQPTVASNEQNVAAGHPG